MQRRPWTASDDAYIRENGGIVPLPDMAAKLHRTQGAVRKRASLLRAGGTDIPRLRVYRPRTRECPECHEARSRFRRNGLCEVCNLQAHLDRLMESAYQMWTTLDPDYQSRTLGNSARFESDHGRIFSYRQTTKPRRPSIEGLSAYMRDKAEDEYAVACEEYAIDELEHKILSVKQRKHRWKAHIRRN